MAKKINIVEAGFVVILVIITEILEFILTFLPVVGELVKWFVNTVAWLTVQFWLKIKGIRGDFYLIASLIEFIPFLNALPTKSITLILTIYWHNKSV